MVPREPRGGLGRDEEGVRENALGGELCRYTGSLMGQNVACVELFKKVKTLEAPNSEAFCFSFKVTVGKWIVDGFVFM